MKKRFFCILLMGILLYTCTVLLKDSSFGISRFSEQFFRTLFLNNRVREVFHVEEEEYVEVFGMEEHEVFL